MLSTQHILLTTIICFAQCLTWAARLPAQEPAQASIDKAHRFLGQATTAKFVLGYAHLGADYSSHAVDGVRYVKDDSGTVIPGKFALVYRYRWDANGAGTTSLGFICDRDGNVERVVVLSTDAILQQPFLVADATIQTLGAVMIEAFKDDMTAADQQLARRMVENADSRGLLALGLRMRQAFGR